MITSRIYWVILSIVTVCGLCSCNWYRDRVTGYNARSFLVPYGYTETKINDSTYRVKYNCSEITAEAICASYLYLRCAELTRDAGFDYFIVDKPNSYFAPVSHYSSGYSYSETVSNTGAYKVTRDVKVPGVNIVKHEPECTATIAMYKGGKPLDDLKAFTPAEIFRYLRDK